MFELLNILFGNNDKEKNKNEIYTEDELNSYGLNAEEKELVKKGEYDPWQFEEEPDELEEDDYYYED